MTKNFLFGFLFSVLLIGLVACGQPAVGKAVASRGTRHVKEVLLGHMRGENS